jgi:FkbM family methyltransferase
MDDDDDDDVIPVMIEVGGHDGITKTMSLKVSRCLHVNTMLIEASPTNYNILAQARPYDTTVHGALCETRSGYATMKEDERNSGQSKLLRDGESSSSSFGTVRVPCTTIDHEMDKLQSRVPQQHLRSKIRLIFLVLDVEGYESVAVGGIHRYPPTKAYIEWTRVTEDQDERMTSWAKSHGLTGTLCGPLRRDLCFNWGPTLFYDDVPTVEPVPFWRELFYGSRKEHPKHTATTSDVSKSYMYYGS